MRSVNNFGSFVGVGRQSTNVPFLEAHGRDGPKGYVGHQRRRHVSIAKTLALISLVLVLVTLSGIILTAIGVVPRWTPSGLWGQEKEMVIGTAIAPSTPPATSRVDNDAMSVDDADADADADAKFDNITINNKNPKIEDLFPEGFIESVLAYHGYIEKTGEEEEMEMELKAHKLNKREPPVEHLCASADLWRGRLCWVIRTERTWINYCHNPNDPENAISTPGECPEGTICTDKRESDGRLHVTCRPKNPPEPDNFREPEPPAKHRSQFGFRNIPATPYVPMIAVQVYKSIQLLGNIPLASFTALFIDSTKSYVLATRNQLNANVFGHNTKICWSGVPTDAGGLECKPKTLWNFRKDDVVSINFGKDREQEGFLFYSIDGS